MGMSFFVTILQGCWETLTMMAPYLLFGFLLSGVLSVVLPVRWVKQHLAKPGKASVVKSAFLGVPLPLCSCGVLPVAAWMRRHGASKGSVGAFLLATPQASVLGFLTALSLLGLGMALYIPLAAFLCGVILGLILNLFSDSAPLLVEEAEGPSQTLPVPLRILRHGFVTLAGDIAVPLAVGILASGILSALVDPGTLSAYGSGLVAKLVIVVIAAPLYVCATSSLPIAASMLGAGLSPGTAFVFLMAGPATNAATFTTIGKLIGKREAVTYLLCVLGLSILAGTLLDLVAPVLPPIEAVCLHGEEIPLWRALSAGLLTGVLITGKMLRMRAH